MLLSLKVLQTLSPGAWAESVPPPLLFQSPVCSWGVPLQPLVCKRPAWLLCPLPFLALREICSRALSLISLLSLSRLLLELEMLDVLADLFKSVSICRK